MMQSEANLQIMVADYLRLQYPNVIFHSDFGSGLKLTNGQAIRQSRQQGWQRGFPDLFIYKARGGYHGLALELKREGARLKKRSGAWATYHILEQAVMLKRLIAEGYEAKFVVGFEQAREAIDKYLTGGEN